MSNPTPKNECQLFLQRRVVKKMVGQTKIAWEPVVALPFHDDPNELFCYVNKDTPHAPLGPMFSSDKHLVTDVEEISREFNSYFSNIFTVSYVNNIPGTVIAHASENTLTDFDFSEPMSGWNRNNWSLTRQSWFWRLLAKSPYRCRVWRDSALLPHLQ